MKIANLKSITSNPGFYVLEFERHHMTVKEMPKCSNRTPVIKEERT
jgi:hypothetical protein